MISDLSNLDVAFPAVQQDDLKDLATFLTTLESAVGRVGKVSSSSLDAVRALAAEVDEDSLFMSNLRASIRHSKELTVLKVLDFQDSYSDLVTYMKATGDMEQLSTSLKQRIDVRWNSTFRMDESIYKVHDDVSSFLLIRSP